MTACSVAGRIGASYTTGTAAGMDPETFAESKLILLWGTNPLTSGHHVFKFMREAQKRGAYVVSIDPIRTRTAERADEWLAPLPGSDAALALGLLHVVLELGAEDREYIAEHTVGFDEFEDRILQFPPARVAEPHGPPRGADQSARRTPRHHPPDRHPLHPGHATPRRRRRRAADAVRHPGHHRRLAVPGRRRRRTRRAAASRPTSKASTATISSQRRAQPQHGAARRRAAQPAATRR